MYGHTFCWNKGFPQNIPNYGNLQKCLHHRFNTNMKTFLNQHFSERTVSKCRIINFSLLHQHRNSNSLFKFISLWKYNKQNWPRILGWFKLGIRCWEVEAARLILTTTPIVCRLVTKNSCYHPKMVAITIWQYA